jgi:hypothetical protein
MAEPMSVVVAARHLKCAPSTVRRWIAKGAPTVSLGKVGRGNGSLVDVGQLRRYLAGGTGADDAAILQLLATGLMDAYKRDGGLGKPAHRTLGIQDYQAAALLAYVFERCAQALTGSVPDPVPAEIGNLMALVEQTARK